MAEVAKRLRKPLMPWQQYAADVALEIDPETGELWYEEVIITVPRQSGKTTLILALMVWRCIVLARSLGAQTVTYLAQSGLMARRKLEREFARIMRASKSLVEVSQRSRARPVKLNEWKLSMNNGSEHILFGTDSYLQVAAPTETGSHGDVLDMPVIDEAFSHEDDLVEQAVDAATVTRRSPQSYVISTAGNERSKFLWRKVVAGRNAILVLRGKPRSQQMKDPSRTCYLEWSVPDDEPFDDPKVWAKYLPALGHTITVARLLARLDKALRNPDEVDEEGYEPGLAGFRRGYLNQWVKTPQLGVDGPRSEISAEEWEALAVDVDKPQAMKSQIVGASVIGVAVSLDGVSASIVVVGRCADGIPQVEVLERQPNVWWVERQLLDFCAKWSPALVAWDNGGPTRTIAPDIQRGCSGVTAAPLTGREWSAACESFRIAVSEKKLRHLGDLLLLDAVNGADRREVGTGWVWDLKTARADITPLVAATAALRALESIPLAAPIDLRIW